MCRLFASALIVLLALCGAAHAEDSGAAFVPGEVLVKLRAAASASHPAEAAIRSEASRSGVHAQVTRSYRRLGVHRLRLEPGLATETAVTLLRANPAVAFAEPNYLVRALAIPNDPSFGLLWGLHNTGQTGGVAGADIDAPAAWDVTTGSASVVIGVVDTGIAYGHPDLAANMWVNGGEIAGDGIDNDGNGYVDDVHGIDAISGSGDPFDDDGHGTHVAGIIGAVGNNSIGVSGVSPVVRLIGCKFLGGMAVGNTADAIECLLYLMELKRNGVNLRAINTSWGGSSASFALLEAIEMARDEDILVVAAAGDGATNNDTMPFYPASYKVSNVLSVAATDHDDALGWFSNFGVASVHLGAPGANITSTFAFGAFPPATDLFLDNMESGNDNWTVDGTWQRTTEQSFSGTFAWSDSPHANYAGGVDHRLTSRAVDLAGVTGFLNLGFYIRHELGLDGDALYLDYSADGGATWSTRTALNGSSGGVFQSYGASIPPSFRTSAFRFRFRLQSNASGSGDGVYIDNVGIGASTPAYDYVNLDGTSMAAAHVTGAAALAAAANPAATASQIRKAILDGTDRVAALADKVSSRGRLNARRTLEWFTNRPPSAVSLVPADLVMKSDGAFTTLTARFADPDGAEDLAVASILIGPTAGSATNALWLDYAVATGRISLKNGNGIGYEASCVIGEPDSFFVTGRVSVNCTGGFVSLAGDTLTVEIPLSPRPGLAAGKRNVYLRAVDSFNAASAWTDKGDFTVKTTNAPVGGHMLLPSVLVSPPDRMVVLSAFYGDADGGANLSDVHMLVNDSPVDTLVSPFLQYHRWTNRLLLAAAGVTRGSCTLGEAAMLVSDLLSVDCARTTVQLASNGLTVNWALTPHPSFASGAYCNVYLSADDFSGSGAGNVDRGNWKITPVNRAPNVGTLTPASLASAALAERTLTAVYSDPDGFGNIASVRLLVNGSATGAGGIYVRYDRLTDMLQLFNESGSGFAGSCKRGSAGVVQNGLAILNCATTMATPSGTSLTMGWRVTPKAAFATGATRNVYLYATDVSGVNAGLSDRGDWTVTP